MMQNPHHYPWCHAPSRVECSRSGGIFTIGRILSEVDAAETSQEGWNLHDGAHPV